MAEGIAGSTVIPLSEFSEIQKERLAFVPPLPPVLASLGHSAWLRGDGTVTRGSEGPAVASWLPRTYGQPIMTLTPGSAAAGDAPAAASVPLSRRKVRVGVLFCGRQSPGGHNVIAGLYDALVELNPDSELWGFEGGTQGLFDRRAVRITGELLSTFRNQGGYHLLGRSVDRLRAPKEQDAALAACEALQLDGLVLIGGIFTNSDAAHLAEFFAEKQSGGHLHTCVIGTPVGIDGDLRNQFVETTLGHDTATKVYSQVCL